MPEETVNWKKVLLISIAVFALISSGTLAGYWYGIRQTRTVGKPPSTSQPTPAPETTTTAQGKIAFVRDGEAWVFDVETKAGRRLLDEGTANVGSDFTWSSDGRYLLWQPIFHGAPALFLYAWDSQKNEIYEFDAFKLGLDSAKYKYSELLAYAWSPSNTEVALLKRNTRKDGEEEYVIERYTFPSFGKIKDIPLPDYYTSLGNFLRYHPSGDGIYFLNGDATERGEDNLVEYSLDGEQGVGFGLGFRMRDFDLSPNGTRVTYITVSTEGVSHLYVTDPKTGKARSIFNNMDSIGLKGFWKVKWSPNGKYLALESALIDTGGVEVLDLAGNVLYRAEADPENLFEEVYGEEKPLQWSWTNFDWSPDGKSLLRIIRPVYPQGLPGLMAKYDLETRELTKLTTTGVDLNPQPAWSPK